jgi:hypothetical protein
LIADFLPNSFSVGEGFITNQESELSSQTDILVVDNLDPRSFSFRADNFFIASDLAVCCLAEVKTRPTKSDFIDAILKLINGSKLIKGADRTTSFLFCYDGPKQIETLRRWLNEAIVKANNGEILPENLPDYVFCFSNGFILERTVEADGITPGYNAVRPRTQQSLGTLQQKIVSDLYQCVVNGCGRLRTRQGINLIRI